MQSIKEPVAVVPLDNSIKSPAVLQQQKNYDSTEQKFIPSHIKKDAQSTISESSEKVKSISSSTLTTSTSVNTIATQTCSNPEDDSEEEDIEVNTGLLKLKSKPTTTSVDDASSKEKSVCLKVGKNNQIEIKSSG